MKTLLLSVATVLVLSINSTASAWVVHAGPVTVAGRPAVARRPVPVVRPVVRPAVVPAAVVQQRRVLAAGAIQDRREIARDLIQDRRAFALEVIQDQRQAALEAILNAQ
jgi:hypothetical protein